MYTQSLDIINTKQGENPMKKIPVSILLWSKYNHYVVDILLRLEKDYKLTKATHNIIGCAEIKGKIYEKDIDEIEKNFHEIVGVFKDSDFPKRPINTEDETLPLLPGEIASKEV